MSFTNYLLILLLASLNQSIFSLSHTPATSGSQKIAIGLTAVAALGSTALVAHKYYQGHLRQKAKNKQKDEKERADKEATSPSLLALEKAAQAGFSFYKSARNAYYSYLLSRPWSSIVKRYMKELLEEEHLLMLEFCKITGTSFDKLQEALNQKAIIAIRGFSESFMAQENGRKNLNCLTETESAEIINFFKSKGVFLDDILLFKYKKGCLSSKYGSPAECSACAIYVYEGLLKQPWKNFVLLHELMHFISADHFLDILVEQSWPEEKVKSDFLCRWVRYREKQADMLAALSGPEEAFQGIEYCFYSPAFIREEFSKYLVELPESVKPSFSHPSDAERMVYIKKIYNEIRSYSRWAPARSIPSQPIYISLDKGISMLAFSAAFGIIMGNKIGDGLTKKSLN